MKNKRLVVCVKCGSLYDLHYIDNVVSHKNKIEKFECKHCGMVDIIVKSMSTFGVD